jgi:hypothetical protein
LGYINEETFEWECDSNIGKNEDGDLVGEIVHFTSYAVLFGSKEVENSNGDTENDIDDPDGGALGYAIIGSLSAAAVFIGAGAFAAYWLKRREKQKEMDDMEMNSSLNAGSISNYSATVYYPPPP